MRVLHLIWGHSRFFAWVESEPTFRPESNSAPTTSDGESAPDPRHLSEPAATRTHPFAASPDEITSLLTSLGINDNLLDPIPAQTNSRPNPTPLQLRLPVVNNRPHPSPRLTALDLESDRDAAFDPITDWETYNIPYRSFSPEVALRVLASLDAALDSNQWCRGQSAQYWITAGRFISGLLVGQRVVPSMAHQIRKGLTASWKLWLHDDDLRRRVALLLRQMPPIVASAVGPDVSDNPWTILERMLSTVTDATIRRYFREQKLIDALDGFDPEEDVHVAWLAGLLDTPNKIAETRQSHQVDTLAKTRSWLGRLAETGKGQEFRLRLELNEPIPITPPASDHDPIQSPDPDEIWPLTFHLESTVDPSATIEAERIWSLQGDIHLVDGHRLDAPQDTLLRELARAGSICEEIQKALDESQPTKIQLKTAQAHAFMRNMYPILCESGFSVIVPHWWDQPDARLAARLQVESNEISDEAAAVLGFSATGKPSVGLDSLVKCAWRIALGEHTLTAREFQFLAKQKSPLVRLRGQWVELRSADLNAALRYFGESHEEELPLRDALRLAYGPESETAIGLPVVGMDASGWVGQLFGSTSDAANESDTHGKSGSEIIRPVPQPEDFIGSLRPYQLRGLAWFAFLERFGLGACLADDMGLGKTIQLIALLQREREIAGSMASQIGPTLLIVPTSVVGNWVREIKRFAPKIRVLVQHGSDRWSGETLAQRASEFDVVITTFALAYRDREDLNHVDWWRVCLDEAQNIKNPAAKQTKAIRQFKTIRRVALTGTPVENRLNELWSIMEFCNPGYLGSPPEFRRQFSIPIERYNDRTALARLRGFVQPFILRRLKTDPRVIADLPEKLEYKIYCSLTTEQARLYENTVEEMIGQTNAADGIKRRGMVLALLIKLKQICNHPAHYQKRPKGEPWPSAAGQSRRSGKTARLIDMLEEVFAEGDSALVFTQFREMGHLLSAIVQADLGVKPLFLHGGTPAKQREKLVDLFQKRDGTHPVFILSLKAGGIGLNLTAANHVFHFDRWWNPAVENQATDRAFRIGQTRAVQVHKFVCSGTLEERIDQMLEQKIELAENVVGSGEQWLTELSTDQLRDVLTLRRDDIADDQPQIIEPQKNNPIATQEATSLLGK